MSPVDPKDRDAARARLRMHPGYEPTDPPPPSPHGGDLPPARAKLPSLIDIDVVALERHGRRVDAIKKIAGGIAILLALGKTVYSATYAAVEYVAEKQFKAFYARFDPAVIVPTEADLAEVEARTGIKITKPPLLQERFSTLGTQQQADREVVSALIARIVLAEKRADAWDVMWLRGHPSRPNVISMPALGPLASKEGK